MNKTKKMIQKRAYCPKDSDFSSYYTSQSGHGYGDIRIVRAPRYQRGYGIGSFLTRLAMPFIRNIGKDLLDKGVSAGKRVVSDPQIQAALKNSISEIANKSLARIKEGPQSGSGRKLYKRRALKTKSKSKSIKKTKIKRKTTPRKKKSRDIFRH